MTRVTAGGILALVLGAWAAFAEPGFDSFEWKELLGGQHCCGKAFSPCETDCSVQPSVRDERGVAECLESCVKQHCKPPKGRCPRRPAYHRNDRGVEHASLDGPGTVTYELYYRGDPGTSFTVSGLLFGGVAERRNPVILRRTEPYTLTPEKPAYFSYSITPDEFTKWIKQYGKIVVGLEDDSHRIRGRWEHADPREVVKVAPGRYLHKSTFVAFKKSSKR